MRVERIVLENNGAMASLGRQMIDAMAVGQDKALGYRLESSQYADGRRLAAARGTEEAQELAILHDEIQIRDGLRAVSIGFGHTSKLYPRHSYFTAPKVRPRTRCFWSANVKTRIGKTAIVPTAIYSPQARPIELEKPARYTGRGAALLGVTPMAKRTSFQLKIADRIASVT